MKHTTRSLEHVYDRFNGCYFLGRLPRYPVRRDGAGELQELCQGSGKVIHLPMDGEDSEAALLHELIHLAVGDTHDDAFRRELERIAATGERAAQRALALEEWHKRTEHVGQRLAEGEPTLFPREVRE